MNVLSDHVINCLKQFEQELKQHAADEKEECNYVKVVREATIELARMFIDHNDSTYWSTQSNRDRFVYLLTKISNNPSECIPSVFNFSSHQYASALLKAINNISADSSQFTLAFSMIITLMGYKSPFDFLIAEINYKIANYETIQKIAADENTMEAWRDEYENLIDAIIVKIETAPIMDQEQFAVIKQQYSAGFQKLIARINCFPYLYMPEFNTDQVDPIKMEIAAAKQLRCEIICGLLTKEKELNEMLKQQGSAQLLRSCYDYCNTLMDEKEEIQRKQVILQKINNLKNDVNRWSSASNPQNPGFFTKVVGYVWYVNPIKQKIVDDLMNLVNASVGITDAYSTMPATQSTNTQLPAESKGSAAQSSGFKCESWKSCFGIYQYLVMSIKANNARAFANHISPGKLAKVLHKHAIEFLTLAITAGNEKNDLLIKFAIKEYERTHFSEDDSPTQSRSPSARLTA